MRDEILITSISLPTSASSRPGKPLFRFGLIMIPIIKVEDQAKVRMIHLLLVGVMLLLLEHGLGLSPGLLLL